MGVAQDPALVAALQPAGSAWSRPRAVEFNSDAPILGAPVLLTVACVKWGDKYGPEYVNKLARACRRQRGESPIRRGTSGWTGR